MKISLYLVLAMLSMPAFCQYILPCDNDSTGNIPLVDQGDTIINGYAGGLYGLGLNNLPNKHYKAGRDIIRNLKPIDSTGAVNYVDGRILFAGMGPSAASHAFNAWRDSMNASYLDIKNKCLYIASTFVGGKSLQSMLDTVSEVNVYWNGFYTQTSTKGIQWDEIQVGWMMQVSEYDTSDITVYVDSSVHVFIEAIQMMKDSMPNLKMLFLTSMHYGGYTSPEHDRYPYLKEPNSYWTGIVFQQLIQLQISGDPRLKFDGPDAQVPFLAWGPYFWADGVNPRGTDSLVWLCSDYRDDTKGGGFHLKDEGKAKEASMLRDFFLEGELGSLLYLDAPGWSACSTIAWDVLRTEAEEHPEKLAIYPNPVNGNICYVTTGKAGDCRTQLYNLQGVLELDETYSDDGSGHALSLDELPAGTYIVKIWQNGRVYNDKVIRL